MYKVKILETYFSNYEEIMDTMILLKLKTWRKKKSKEMRLPAFLILLDIDLINLVKSKPKTIIELLDVKGFGASKTIKHGDDIISMINRKKRQ